MTVHSPFSLLCLSMLLPAIVAAADPPAASPPDVGQNAIDFELPIVGGEGSVRLSDQYKQGPVVVVVLRGYPGYQCPLCSKQVSALANRAKGLAQVAHKVILVYPGQPNLLERHAEEFLGSRKLPEPLVLVRDEGMKMVDQWGLRWNAPKETAYPSTFVIDSSGKIVWKMVSQSHAGRSTVDEIHTALRKL